MVQKADLWGRGLDRTRVRGMRDRRGRGAVTAGECGGLGRWRATGPGTRVSHAGPLGSQESYMCGGRQSRPRVSHEGAQEACPAPGCPEAAAGASGRPRSQRAQVRQRVQGPRAAARGGRRLHAAQPLGALADQALVRGCGVRRAPPSRSPRGDLPRAGASGPRTR